MSAAQEEFDRLFNQKEKFRSHPEDRAASDNDSLSSSDDDDEDDDDDDNNYVHSDPENDSWNTMSKTATYTVPSTVFEANTGPKGVIADAQSFERARKRSFRRTLLHVAGFDTGKRGRPAARPQHGLASTESSFSENDEEEFMRRWRESRLQELRQGGRRKKSPSKRVHGSVETVDAVGYLDAIEKVPQDTVVVVCIYDPEVRCSLD
jgi:Phosducin